LSRNPAANAMIRTTTAVTLIEGGVKVNVLPADATATVNFRVHPQDTCAGVTEHVRRAVDDPAVEIEVVRANEPSPVSDASSAAYRLLERTLAQVAPGAIVAPGLVLGGTDTKHYAAVADASFRFTPSRLGPEDLSRPHGVDERLSVENYREIIAFYRLLLEGAQTGL
jgi:carboxypeptidase PM20D1